MARVPSITSVVPGARVNIILKADQPTGRTVSGAVQDVLTRGNHPRGIKVRLTDGKIGRVHSMADPETNPAADADGTRTAEDGLGLRGADTSRPRWPGQQRADRGGDPPYELPSQQIGLDAYIRSSKVKKNRSAAATTEDLGGGTNSMENHGSEVETITCPVCGEFNGDTKAVEHHVATHFDD